MQESTKNLVLLQEVELERARLEQEKQRLPRETSRSEKTLATAQQQSAAATAALSREEALRDRLAREIAGHRQKAERFRSQLDSVTTPEQAAAIEHELQFASTEMERLENEAFTSLERTETQETELAQARKQVELFAAELDTVRASVAERQKDFTAQAAELMKRREELRGRVEPDLLQRFDRMVASRGTGIARADNQQCNGCRMGVRPQLWNQLREGELLSCDSCGRLLYWDDTIAQQAKAPQPEILPGQGQAVRKSRQAGV